eukprot:COSAG04_NODE_825_length_10050_cov_15.525676_2_plen_1515_part_00
MDSLNPSSHFVEWMDVQADDARGEPAEENERVLRKAARDGYTAEVRVLLAAGTDPDAADEDGWTPLFWAAREGHEEAVGALAEGGADLDKTDNNGVTPLMAAANNGHSVVVRRLLELGADHTAVGTGGEFEGKTALEHAEAEGKEEAAAVLREHAASHPDEQYDAHLVANFMKLVDEMREGRSEENEEALRKAARGGRVAEVRMLLAAGTDPDAADEDGQTALRLAAGRSHEEAVGALAEGGANLDKEGEDGLTPLMYAARFGQSDAVRRLLELGADHAAVGTIQFAQSKVALEVADYYGKKEAAAVLREWAASHPDEEYDARIAANDEEQVARAAGPKVVAMYEALGEEDKAKADEARGRPVEENEAAMGNAVEVGKTAEVRVLLAAGTDPDAAHGNGTTALHYAAAMGREEAVGALAEGGADLDKADSDGETPLMKAAYRGRSGVVRRLLELGADHTAVGTGDWCKGKTALELADAEGEEAAAAVLREWAASHCDVSAGKEIYDSLSAEEQAMVRLRPLSISPVAFLSCSAAHSVNLVSVQADEARNNPAEENEQALRSAAQHGQTAEVRVLLAAGTDPGAANGDGWTALHYAALPSFSLKPGADTKNSGSLYVDATGARVTVEKGVFAAVDGRWGNVVYGPDSDGDCKLRWVDDGNISSYIRTDRMTNVVSSRDNLVEDNSGHEEAVAALAEGGADLDKADNRGATPLMVAADKGHSGVVRQLLELDADHTAVGTTGPWEGKTALEVAEDVKGWHEEEEKKNKEEAAAVLREWATSHPDAEYDARVAAADARKAERERRAATIYKALGEEDRAKADDVRGKPAEENEQALRKAASNGEMAAVRVLLAAGTDPDAADRDGRTALHYAALPSFSLKPGAETGVAVEQGVFAAVDGRWGEVTYGPDDDGDCKLRWLDDDNTSRYIPPGEMTSVVASRDDLVEDNSGLEDIVAALAEGGADLDKANEDGTTPLMTAADVGQSGAVRRLLELGVDHTAVCTGGRYKGKTALEVAEEKGKEEAAAVLREWAASHPNAEYDARVVAYDGKMEREAEKQAARAAGPKAKAMYETLSEEGKAKADRTRGRPAEKNEEALRDVAMDGETATVRVLLAAGIDPDAAGGNGRTALHWAAAKGREEAVDALAAGGADLDKTDNNGVTPLMVAAEKGHSVVVRRLLELGADGTAVGTGGRCWGKTALELAKVPSDERWSCDVCGKRAPSYRYQCCESECGYNICATCWLPGMWPAAEQALDKGIAELQLVEHIARIPGLLETALAGADDNLVQGKATLKATVEALVRQGQALDAAVASAVDQWKELRGALADSAQVEGRKLEASDMLTLQMKAAPAILRGQSLEKAVTDQMREWMLARDIAEMHVKLRAGAEQEGFTTRPCLASLESTSAAKMKEDTPVGEAVAATLAEWQEIMRVVSSKVGGRDISEGKQVELQAKVAAAVLRGKRMDAAADAAVSAWTHHGTHATVHFTPRWVADSGGRCCTQNSGHRACGTRAATRLPKAGH